MLAHNTPGSRSAAELSFIVRSLIPTYILATLLRHNHARAIGLNFL
jgi:hypothetical protein